VSNSLSYNTVRFKIEVGIEKKFMCKNVTKQTQHVHCDSSDNADLRGGHMHDLDLTVNMLGLCDPSNLLFEYSFYLFYIILYRFVCLWDDTYSEQHIENRTDREKVI